MNPSQNIKKKTIKGETDDVQRNTGHGAFCWQALILVPFMLSGLFAGIKSSEIIPEKTVRKLVIVLLLFSGILMAYKY